MWYFSWILGLGIACSFAILNAMWLELDPAYVDSVSARPKDEA
jgi:cytochrome bd-I ubiquinol oxidase subunit X